MRANPQAEPSTAMLFAWCCGSTSSDSSVLAPCTAWQLRPPENRGRAGWRLGAPYAEDIIQRTAQEAREAGLPEVRRQAEQHHPAGDPEQPDEDRLLPPVAIAPSPPVVRGEDLPELRGRDEQAGVEPRLSDVRDEAQVHDEERHEGEQPAAQVSAAQRQREWGGGLAGGRRTHTAKEKADVS